MGKALHELAALLHDGQVGGEVGIEHVVKTHDLQRRHHALGGGELGVKVEILRPGGADGRRHLHHHDAVRVGQGVEHLAGVIPLLQAAHGTVGDALAAERTVALAQGTGAGHAHRGVGACAHQIPDAHGLDLLAELDAAHTLDAAVLHPHHRVGEIVGDAGKVILVVVAQQVVVVGQPLELAVAAAGAFGTLGVVLAQQQPQIDSPGLADTG